MSLFIKKKRRNDTTARKSATMSQRFDTGHTVAVKGLDGGSLPSMLSEGANQSEYDVPASGWPEPELPRAQGVVIDGEYEVAPSGWPDVSAAQDYSGGHEQEYEVADAASYLAESQSVPSADTGNAEEADWYEADDSEAALPADSVAASPGQSDTSKAAEKPGSEKSEIDEAMVADDIRSIMMAVTEPEPEPQEAQAQRKREAPEEPPPVPTGGRDEALPQAPENVRKKMESEHAIFDRIAESMKYANAYDLGSIALEQRFDAFDDAQDNVTAQESGKKDPPAPAPAASTPAKAKPDDKPVQQQDFIEDLDLITQVIAQQAGETIPLDPGVGGRSIGESALEPGDIILSTTTEDISKLIRSATGSEVSHSAIYIGNGQVVEAIDSGVIVRSLDTALDDDTLAVAYRHRDMTSEKARQVVDYLKQQARAKRTFDNWGLVRAAPGQLARAVCNRLDGELRRACLAGANELKVGTDDENAFFCSELVLAALKEVGLSITDIDPSWSSPEQIVNLHLNGLLDYVGHLKV